ncbi:cold shock domain-containing protein [Sphingomonas sp. ASV193]|uniref:cold-shock protein n=1 Tax=Sphingomonas sp. ASV193 TaxID=3144405 RepID=UPI0032E8D12B
MDFAERSGVGGKQLEAEAHDTSESGFRFDGRVKWFDATRGFGFAVCDGLDGDVLIHFSVLKAHDRRSLPEGATVSGVAVRQARGLQATEIDDIDLSTALPTSPVHANGSAVRADRQQLAKDAGPFEPVEVKWFNRVKGYGFLNRIDGNRDPYQADEDIFLHMETVRAAGIPDLAPGQRIEARIAEGRKGLTAVEVQLD